MKILNILIWTTPLLIAFAVVTPIADSIFGVNNKETIPAEKAKEESTQELEVFDIVDPLIFEIFVWGENGDLIFEKSMFLNNQEDYDMLEEVYLSTL